MPMADVAVVNAGERLALQCAVIKGGLPMTVNWLKETSPATNAAGVHVKLINDFTASLTVESLTGQHAGLYTCWVRNEGGRAQSTVTVVVQGNQLPMMADNEQCGLLNGPQMIPFRCV